MITRKKHCYFPQANSKPFAVHHNDFGIFSEIQITNVSGNVEIAGITINDEFTPTMEVGTAKWFRPLKLPKALRFGASLAVALQGPAFYLEPEACYRRYPKKVAVLLSDGVAVSFGLWDIVRTMRPQEAR